MKKHILIAGGGGYIGAKLVEKCIEAGLRVTVLDRFFFGEVFGVDSHKSLRIIKDDIRLVEETAFKGVDVVIDLASISNDPSADLNPKISMDINFGGACRLAKLAKQIGVEQYIFSSSCSVYGDDEGIVTEDSDISPLSIYAKSKALAEEALLKLSDKKFCVTCLRNATVYGVSKKRMRFDLMVNIMTLNAWRDNQIYVRGGGRQWRPLIHLDDCIKVFFLLINEPDRKKINGQIFNIGSNEQNFQVLVVANKFRKYFPDIKIEILPEDIDKRSYLVNFDKISRVLGFRTDKNVDDGIKEIIEALDRGEISDDLRTSTQAYYQYLIEGDKILDKVKLNNKLF